MAEVLSNDLAENAAKRFFSRWIHSRHFEMLVQLDDRIHGAVNQPAEFFLALVHLGLSSETTQLGCSARRKNLKQSVSSRLFGHRSQIEDSEMPENLAVEIEQRHAHVAGRSDCPDIRVITVKV